MITGTEAHWRKFEGVLDQQRIRLAEPAPARSWWPDPTKWFADHPRPLAGEPELRRMVTPAGAAVAGAGPGDRRAELVGRVLRLR